MKYGLGYIRSTGGHGIMGSNAGIPYNRTLVNTHYTELAQANDYAPTVNAARKYAKRLFAKSVGWNNTSLNQTEIKSGMEQIARTFDKDSNGIMSRKEWKQMMRFFDHNGDGKVNAVELERVITKANKPDEMAMNSLFDRGPQNLEPSSPYWPKGWGSFREGLYTLPSIMKPRRNQA
jgi:hypothetical protein